LTPPAAATARADWGTGGGPDWLQTAFYHQQRLRDVAAYRTDIGAFWAAAVKQQQQQQQNRAGMRPSSSISFPALASRKKDSCHS